MTVLEIANFVCGKVVQFDGTSLEFCKQSINRRAQMIQDAYLWHDLESQWRNVATVAAQDHVALPLEFDRVVSIRCDNKTFLDPVTTTFLVETDPGIFERLGMPQLYEEYQVFGTKLIALYPVPDRVYSLNILGKFKFVTLGDDDTPILRNIDNALLSYVTGDMLERQRQYGKAQVKFTEASAHLEAMKAIETQQTNQPRQTKQLTVAGDSLAEMTDAVCARCGTFDLATRIIIKDFIRRNYQAIYDSVAWRESHVIANMDREDSEVVLPEYFDRVESVRANPELSELWPTEMTLPFGMTPTIFEQTGSPVAFSFLTSVAVAVLPETTEKLYLVSSDDTDKSSVFVRGETGGVEVSETVTLTGTTPVLTFYAYDTPLTIAKGITLGDVTISGFGETFYQKIPANERERKHIRIWLLPTPDNNEANKCLILGKRKIKPLLTDEDTPIIRGIGNALISASLGDVYSKLGNKDGATEARAMASAAVKSLLEQETSQSAYSPRIIPYVESAFGDDPSDGGGWLMSKSWYG